MTGVDIPGIGVVVADDDARVRSVLRSILNAESDMTVLGEAGDGNEAVAVVRAFLPDVVLLDVRMPGTSGIDAARAIRQSVPGAAIVMLTVSDDDDDLHKAVLAGAHGYLLKDIDLFDVVGAVRTAATGQSVLSAGLAARLAGDGERGEGSAASPAGDCSRRVNDKC
jgi:two-component system NarL family response regulator